MSFDIEKWVHDHKSTKFEWGVTDCCLFTGDYILAVTGVDPAEPYRGHYSTETGAKRALLKYGTIENAIDDSGFKRVDFNFAKRGDVVLFDTELGQVLGIKWTGGVLGLTFEGLVVTPVRRADVVATWSILSE